MSNIQIKRSNAKKNISFIILTACAGKRMKTYGLRSLINLGPETVIDRQITTILKSYLNPEIIVVGGFEYEKLRKYIKHKYLLHLIKNSHYEDLNNTYGLALGLDSCTNKNIVVINGDIVFNKNTILNLPENSGLVVDEKNYIERTKVGVSYQNNKILNLSYSIKTKWAQILFIHNNTLNKIENIIYNIENQKLFIYECLNKAIDQEIRFSPIINRHAKFIEINNYNDINLARQIKD